MPPPDDQRPPLEEALEEHFGFTQFRGPQREICEHVLDQGSGLVVMATGDGKSLCFQLPALLQDGLTLVVSPLIALMDDQVAALRKKGLPAARIHSNLDGEMRRRTLAEAKAGEHKLLYVTPERFRVKGFLDSIKELDIALLAIDEAHCLSQWGHDFRPDYLKLGEMRAALGDPPTLALTATATPRVQQDIRDTLRLPDAPLWHTGIERPNLFLAATEARGFEEKLDRLVELLKAIGGSGIVYTALIQELSKIEDALLRRGLKPLVYHGQLSPEERRQQQRRFIDGSDTLVLATPAFGMGVDKPDIRFVVHWQIPRTLEAYYQEVGRAGRDGESSYCELLFSEDDVAVQRNFVEWANPGRELLTRLTGVLAGLGDRAHALDEEDLRMELGLPKRRRDGRVGTALRLLRTAGVTEGELGDGLRLVRLPDHDEIEELAEEDKHQADLEGLLEMVRYAKLEQDTDEGSDRCRKRALHRHFGIDDPFPDEGCGSCDGEHAPQRWLAEHMEPRSSWTPKPIEQPTAEVDPDPDGDGEFPVERGEWISVKGHGLCAVSRVFRSRQGWRAEVERARDLQKKTIDLWRVRWRKVEE